MATCTATTSKGAPCKGRAKKGDTKCAVHLGTAHRPIKLNEQILARVIEALEVGNYREVAARYAGISITSFYSYMERGEADREAGNDTLFAQFADGVESAESQAETVIVGLIRRAASGFTDPTTQQRVAPQWQAGAWLLERKNPQRWGRRDNLRLEHEGRVEAIVLPDDPARLRDVAGILSGIGALPEDQ